MNYKSQRSLIKPTNLSKIRRYVIILTGMQPFFKSPSIDRSTHRRFRFFGEKADLKRSLIKLFIFDFKGLVVNHRGLI